MSVNDLLEMDLLPILFFIIIIGFFFWLFYIFKVTNTKSDFKNTREITENNVTVISKEKGERINIGGTVANPIKGYLCTMVFETENGSRLVLKTTKSNIYDTVLVGDLANVKHKQGVLTYYQVIK